MEPRCNHKHMFGKERDVALTKRDRQRKQGREQGGCKPSAGGSRKLGDFPMELWSEEGLVNTSSSLLCITVILAWRNNFVENCYHSFKKLIHPPEYFFVIINLLRLRAELKLEPDL